MGSSSYPPFDIMNHGTVSKEQYELIRLTVEIILKPAVCIVGIFLNSMGIYVLLKPRLRHGFYIYLSVLSLADVSYLLLGLLRTVVEIYAMFDQEAALKLMTTVMPYAQHYLEPCFAALAAYCIMVFSLDRLMAIVRPLHVRSNVLTLRSRQICISMVFIIFIINLPLLNLEVIVISDPTTNLSLVIAHARHHEGSILENELMKAYAITFDVIFMYTPPVFVIAVNMGIVIQIQRMRRTRERTFPKDCVKVKGSGQQKLVITVVIISCFFLGVYIPLIIIRNMTSTNPEYRFLQREDYMGRLFHMFISFGWSINAAIDFIVYLATSAQFRHSVRDICGRRNTRCRTSSTSSTDFRKWQPSCVDNSGSYDNGSTQSVCSSSSNTTDIITSTTQL